MKAIHRIMLTVWVALAILAGGCVIHEDGYHHVHHHGPGCGHELRGGIWVAVPVIEVH